MSNQIPDEFLHVYAQYVQHGEAVIRGTRAALLRVKQAIEDAIERGEGSANVLATDGEGYQIVVVASNTVAGIGQPEYVSELEQRAFQREKQRWANLNEPIRWWDDIPSKVE